MNNRNDIIDVETAQPRAVSRADSLKTWGWVSYILHLIVAVGAVLPGAQVSIALLIIALVMDLVKKDDAAGSWQESHFKWRINSVLWAGVLYLVTAPLWLFFLLPGWILKRGRRQWPGQARSTAPPHRLLRGRWCVTEKNHGKER